MKGKKWLTIKEVADALEVSRQRVHAIIAFHEIKTELVTSRLRVMSVDEFKRLKALRKKTLGRVKNVTDVN